MTATCHPGIQPIHGLLERSRVARNLREQLPDPLGQTPPTSSCHQYTCRKPPCLSHNLPTADMLAGYLPRQSTSTSPHRDALEICSTGIFRKPFLLHRRNKNQVSILTK